MMSDEQLKDAGIQFYGDRVALKAHASCEVQDNAQEKDTAKSSAASLLERIKNKLGNTSKKCEKKMTNLKGNMNARKVQRRVELGWIMKYENKTKQVRAKTGGGTRHMKVNSDSTVEELKQIALNLFFTNGSSSTWGNVEKYVISMTDFDTTPITDETTTLQELYERSKSKIQRLYLCTSKKAATDTDNSNDNDDTDCSFTVQMDSPVEKKPKNTEPDIAEFFTIDDLLFTSMTNTPVNFTEFSPQHHDTSNSNTISSTPDSNNSDEEIQFKTTGDDIDTTVEKTNIVIKLHRGHVLEELEDYFMENDFSIRNTDLHIQMILPNGQEEKADDNGGVLRDALSEYWESFYMRRTNGNILKVPALSHAIDKKRWMAVGQIIVVGYYYEQYFPAQLASCFMEYTTNGDCVPKEVLLSQFLHYLPESERRIAETCLNDFENADKDDLMDLLEDHNVRVAPTKTNIKRLFEETAHKELIQVPTYIADCWRPYLAELKPLLEMSFMDMNNNMLPTFKSVWKTIIYDNDVNTELIAYLKKFLKELSTPLLQRFLRFCTGKNK